MSAGRSPRKLQVRLTRTPCPPYVNMHSKEIKTCAECGPFLSCRRFDQTPPRDCTNTALPLCAWQTEQGHTLETILLVCRRLQHTPTKPRPEMDSLRLRDGREDGVALVHVPTVGYPRYQTPDTHYHSVPKYNHRLIYQLV